MRHPGPRQEGRSYASDPLRGQRTGALVRHLDRKALPDTESDGYARRGYEAPVGETEVTLAELWSEVLGVERVGRRDHFFELGGHSLLAVRLIERMRRRGLFADVQALLTAPTLAEMAATVSDEPIVVAVPENLITDDGDGRARGRADDFELLL